MWCTASVAGGNLRVQHNTYTLTRNSMGNSANAVLESISGSRTTFSTGNQGVSGRRKVFEVGSATGGIVPEANEQGSSSGQPTRPLLGATLRNDSGAGQLLPQRPRFMGLECRCLPSSGTPGRTEWVSMIKARRKYLNGLP